MKSEDVKLSQAQQFIAKVSDLDFHDEINMRFMARAMVQATMPHSNPKTFSFSRRNGDFELTMIANPKIGLPYGSMPRLLLCWLTSEAVKKQSRELILGDSLSAFMRELGLSITGGRWGSITRLKNQVYRLFTSSISATYRNQNEGAGVNFVIAEEYHLWWAPQMPEQRSLWESRVSLSDRFYKEIISAPIPLRLETLNALKNSSVCLDIYSWLTYRNSYATKPSYIPWGALQLQFGAGYPLTAHGKADFKRKFLDALQKVGFVYPAAKKVKDEGECLLYIPGEPDVPKKQYVLSTKSGG